MERRAESPALRQIRPTPFPIAGRIVGVVAGQGADLAGIASLRTALEAQGALLRVIAPHGGQLVKGKNVEIVERTFATGRSIEFDALVVAEGAPEDGDFRAGDAAGGLPAPEGSRDMGDGVEVLRTAGIDPEAPGVLTGKKASAKLAAATVAALGLHRAWDRTPLVNASLVPPTT